MFQKSLHSYSGMYIFVNVTLEIADEIIKYLKVLQL